MWEGKEDKHKDVYSYVVASTHLIFVQHSISYLAVIFGTSELKWFSFPQQIAIHRGSFDVGVCCTRWKTSFWFYWFWLNQLCLSTVKVLKVVFYPALFSHLQHALPRSLPAGSRWHHVTDHQHAGRCSRTRSRTRMSFKYWAWLIHLLLHLQFLKDSPSVNKNLFKG